LDTNEFDWSPFFNKVFEKDGAKKLIKCRVCGDLLFYADDSDIRQYGWHIIPETEANKEFCLCNMCADVGYSTLNEAKEMDDKYDKINGYHTDSVTGEPLRGTLTWDEHQSQVESYKQQLNEYLKINCPELIDLYKKLSEKHEVDAEDSFVNIDDLLGD